jgi:hypothetical protein
MQALSLAAAPPIVEKKSALLTDMAQTMFHTELAKRVAGTYELGLGKMLGETMTPFQIFYFIVRSNLETAKQARLKHHPEEEVDKLEKLWRVQVSAAFGKANPDPTIDEVIGDLYAASQTELECSTIREWNWAKRSNDEKMVKNMYTELVRGRRCRSAGVRSVRDPPMFKPEERPPRYLVDDLPSAKWWTPHPPAPRMDAPRWVQYNAALLRLIRTEVFHHLEITATEFDLDYVEDEEDYNTLVAMSFLGFFKILRRAVEKLEASFEPEVMREWKRNMSLAYGKASSAPGLVEVAGDLYANLLKSKHCTNEHRTDIEVERGLVCRAVTVPSVDDDFIDDEDFHVTPRLTPGTGRSSYFVPKGSFGESWLGLDLPKATYFDPTEEGFFHSSLGEKTLAVDFQQRLKR